MIRLGVVILLGGAACLSQDARFNCPGPLTEPAVLRLVQGKVADSRLMTIVTTCGIGFTVTAAVQRKLKQSGASNQLLATLKTLRPAKGNKSSVIPDWPLRVSIGAPQQTLVSHSGKIVTLDVVAVARSVKFGRSLITAFEDTHKIPPKGSLAYSRFDLAEYKAGLTSAVSPLTMRLVPLLQKYIAEKNIDVILLRDGVEFANTMSDITPDVITIAKKGIK